MQSSAATERLGSTLEKIATLSDEISGLEAKVKELEKRKDALEEIAVEEMAAGRLDGVRVAGRSWRVSWEHRISATAAQTDAVLAAVKTLGLSPAEQASLVGVNTGKIKTMLKEMAEAAGKDVRAPWADGTPLAGLIHEYVQPVLRSQKAGR